MGAETERILVGHFLTREEGARKAGIPLDEVVNRPDLLRIGGVWLPEVYFAFQFDASGIRPGMASVVRDLKKHFDDLVVADWLARPNAALRGASPIRWVATGGSDDALAKAAANAGPLKSQEPGSAAWLKPGS